MPGKKIIAVLGATGAQGGGLVRAILADTRGEFTARAITRDVNSAKAKALAALGAEVVSASVDDQASLRQAFAGAYGAFCITFYWDHLSPEKEMEHARNMALAAKQAGVEHVIWSTLDDTRRWIPLSDDRMPTLMGKYKVPHFDAKGAADHFFTDAGVPTTFLLTTFYWDNMIFFGSGPKKDASGKLALTFPMGEQKLAGIAAEDIGKCAYGIFKAGKEYVGKSVGIAGEHLTVTEMAAEMTKALGQPVYYNHVEPAVFRSFGFPGADDLGNMFQFYRDCAADFLRSRDPAVARKLNPELKTFSQWLKENAGRIPLE